VPPVHFPSHKFDDLKTPFPAQLIEYLIPPFRIAEFIFEKCYKIQQSWEFAG